MLCMGYKFFRVESLIFAVKVTFQFPLIVVVVVLEEYEDCQDLGGSGLWRVVDYGFIKVWEIFTLVTFILQVMYTAFF